MAFIVHGTLLHNWEKARITKLGARQLKNVKITKGFRRIFFRKYVYTSRSISFFRFLGIYEFVGWFYTTGENRKPAKTRMNKGFCLSVSDFENRMVLHNWLVIQDAFTQLGKATGTVIHNWLGQSGQFYTTERRTQDGFTQLKGTIGIDSHN